jgi:hypothetical protein
MNKFISIFSKNIKFSYTSYDRVIIKGYIRWLFTAGSLINFLRAKGFRKFTNGVMRIFTDQLNSHIEKEASKYNIPIHWWPSHDGGKNGDKLRYVEDVYAKKVNKKHNFTYCIIADREAAFTYATRNLLTKKGQSYDKMYKCRKFVKYYYIYFHDQLLGGPCYLKLSTYFPFHAEFYFNGQNAIRLQMDKRGLAYRKDGNAFTMIEDPQVVQQIAWSLSGKQVRERINYWMGRFFRFDKGKYSTLPKELKHEWYCSQVEVCTNMIFKSAIFCTKLFERLLDKFTRIGSPDSLSQLFGKRRAHKDSKSTWRLYDNKACLKSWIKSNAIKFYNKLGYYLRIETTINNPKWLGLNKPVIYVREYLTFGDKCNRRLMVCFADVDVNSISNGEYKILDLPLMNEKGQKVAALDVRKDRQVALFKELLKPHYNVHWFQTRELLKNLPEFFKNSGQIRYELIKLKERGLVEKNNNKNLWRATEKGYQLLWLKTAWNLHFEVPMISRAYNSSVEQSVSQPSKLEAAYKQIDEGLILITQELYMNKAA